MLLLPLALLGVGVKSIFFTSRRREEGDIIGPTMINMEKKSNGELNSNGEVIYNGGLAESPVQIVKIQGSNCLCSRGGASPDVILVSIAAVAKRACTYY